MRTIRGRGKRRAGGFTLIELLLGMTILSVGLLAIAGMFSTGYVDVSSGGNVTMAAAAGRQILEDVRTLPFANIAALNGFRTDQAGTLPAANPEREVARKWRYALAGEGQGFTFTAAEKAEWATLSGSSGINFGARGQITVASPSLTLRLVTITITPTGRTVPVQIATLVSRP